MFSYFLNPNRLLLSAFLLLMCSLFVVPIYRVETHMLFLTFVAFYIIAFFKVRKKGIEYYAERINTNKKILIPLFIYCIILLVLEYFKIVGINSNSILLTQIFVYIPIITISFIFFLKVFFKK